MNKALLIELVSLALTAGLILLLFNPFNIWMPMPFHLLIVATLLISTVVLSLVLLRQLKEDEREQKLRLFSYQAGYMIGMFSLVCGVIFQSFSHQVEPWMVVTLLLMFLSKMVALSLHHLIH
jgi:hypothetical protein